MPWKQLRREQSERRGRNSTLHPDPVEGRGQEQDQGKGNDAESGSRYTSRPSTSVSDLRDHGHDLHISVSQGQDPYPYGRSTQTTRPQRFSLLRFRHASDSQLSRTARDQSMTRPPPVPTGKPISPGSILLPMIRDANRLCPQLQLSSLRRRHLSHSVRSKSEGLRSCFHAARSHKMALPRFQTSPPICLCLILPPILAMTGRASLRITQAHEHPASCSMSRRDKELRSLLQHMEMILIQPWLCLSLACPNLLARMVAQGNMVYTQRPRLRILSQRRRHSSAFPGVRRIRDLCFHCP